MQRLLLPLVFAAIFIPSYGQQNAPRIRVSLAEGPVPWSHLNFRDDARHFQFAIVADRTGGARPGVFERAIRKLNLLQPELVMSIGDLIEGYTTDTLEIDRQWKEFTGFTDRLQMPFFYVPGNHDITNKVMENMWKARFGPTYYHFVYRDVLFLCLNSEDNIRGAGKGSIDDAQYEYVKNTLDANRNARWTLLFMHQPLWNQDDSRRWKDVEALLAERKHTVFVGHNHHYRKYERNGGKYIIVSTTGGWHRERGPDFGEFDHMVWVTMTDDGPIIANLMLDGIWDENIIDDAFAGFMLPLAGNDAVKVQPWLVAEAPNARTTLKLRIANHSNYPMQADFFFKANPHLYPVPSERSLKLNPNSTELIDLNIETMGRLIPDEINPLRMQYRVEYAYPDRLPVEMNAHLNLKPEPVLPLLHLDLAPEIDGRLQEWTDLPYGTDENPYLETDPFSHQGREDGAFRFGLGQIGDFLYLGVDVRDDQLWAKPGTAPQSQDGIHILLDARPLQTSSLGRGEEPFVQYFYLGLSPTESPQAYQKQLLPEGTRFALLKTAEGYQLEAAVPLSYLEKLQGADWKYIRLNVIQSDFDENGRHRTLIGWKPDWRGEDNYVGSGIFERK